MIFHLKTDKNEIKVLFISKMIADINYINASQYRPATKATTKIRFSNNQCVPIQVLIYEKLQK